MRGYFKTGQRSGVSLGGCSMLLLSPLLLIAAMLYVLGVALVVTVFLVVGLVIPLAPRGRQDLERGAATG